MADYDRAELERLQREAAARMREMQARAQPAGQPHSPARRQQAAGHRSEPPTDTIPMPSFVRIPNERADRPAEKEHFPPPAETGSTGKQAAPAGGRRPEGHKGGREGERPKTYIRKKQTGLDLMQMLNFKNIHLDSDRTLILLILLLLSGEEKDQYLTMALLYLLL